MSGNNIQPVNIENDPYAVYHYLRDMEGKICDAWNEGLVMDIKDDYDVTGLYHLGWRSLSVTPILDYKLIAKLPDDIYQFVCWQLKQIEINIPKRQNTKTSDAKAINHSPSLFSKKQKPQNENEKARKSSNDNIYIKRAI